MGESPADVAVLGYSKCNCLHNTIQIQYKYKYKLMPRCWVTPNAIACTPRTACSGWSLPGKMDELLEGEGGSLQFSRIRNGHFSPKFW